jgi:hypothetical protein
MKILKFYLPGLIFATTGLVIFTKFQTKSNYYLLHSIWHICISISIVFFLPDRNSSRSGGRGKYKKSNEQKTISSQTIPSANGIYREREFLFFKFTNYLFFFLILIIKGEYEIILNRKWV